MRLLRGRHPDMDRLIGLLNTPPLPRIGKGWRVELGESVHPEIPFGGVDNFPLDE